MTLHVKELDPSDLRWSCDSAIFTFESTADIPPLKGIVEQERPVRAIRFGLDISSPGYNIYVSGLTGTGKTTVIKMFLDEIAATMPTPDDWCYVYNFRDPNSPTVFNLPAGTAKILKAEMSELVRQLKSEIPKAFESKEYEQSMNALIQENQAQQQGLFEQLQEKARVQGFMIEVTKLGVSLVPVIDGKPLPPEQFEALGEGSKKAIEKRRTGLQDDINAFLRQVRDVNKASRDKVNELQRRVGLYVVGVRIDGIKEQHTGYPQVIVYLEDVQDYILSHLEDFMEDSQKQDPAQAQVVKLEAGIDPFLKYKVNVVVDNTDVHGAPVVIETNPTFYNVFGRIERRAQYGTLLTDFTMIRSGSYAKANGGYLVVNAHDVLMNFGVWETLKRTVKNKEVRIEDLGEQYGAIPVAAMRPSPIPACVKVIMIGNQQIYHLLYCLDEDFRKIFKVKADFDSEMGKDETALHNYASFVASRCHDEGLLHFDPSGVAEVIEYGAWLVDDQTKLSARFSDIADIVREASYWAREAGANIVSVEHVRRAVEEKCYRSNLVEERLRELITDGTIMVDVTGAEVGQVNGLAVIDLGDLRFGKPSRITAKTFMGKGGLVDIERECKMSGRIYEKGVLILSGYLGAKYAQERPLSLAASLCFEQSYEGVDGDSASSTEIYALLSSLSGIPIKQGIAVTGSVNQHGQIQPIGGVNQKIEGFFEVCRAKGLTGDQGVMIPSQNVKNLMLRTDVVEAVAKGKFHIYPVCTIDEGIEILTDVPAGERLNGCYPQGSINYCVDTKLMEFAEGLKKFASDSLEEDEVKTGRKEN
ncbi:MAG TPA: ATP-binding protein [Acidobacteriota bacterium]|nr:ATP-binding protein [Acidobacteriota bacterium]